MSIYNTVVSTDENTVKPAITDIDKILPPVSRFSGGEGRRSVRSRNIKKDLTLKRTMCCTMLTCCK